MIRARMGIPGRLLMAGVVLLGVVVAGYGAYVSAQQDAVNGARAAWRQCGVDHYRMAVEVTGPTAGVGSYQVTVVHGAAVEVVKRGAAGSTPVAPEIGAIASYLTVERMFDFAAARIESHALAGWRAEFDPDLGYIRSFSFSCVSDLARPAADECRIGFAVTALEILG
ncbi:MAG: hypothetical protein JXB47_11185 [Anaerolineae bacterium]|nr:hypothetical protein [Anaerolineae bacterium]